MHPCRDAPFFQNRVVDGHALKHKREKQTNRKLEIKKIMSHCWLKSPRPGLLTVEENEQCCTAKYRAEFHSIGSRSPERKQTRSGLGGWGHLTW